MTQVVRSLKEPIMSFYKTELPKTTKNLGPFYIGRYEVTSEQYAPFVKEAGIASLSIGAILS